MFGRDFLESFLESLLFFRQHLQFVGMLLASVFTSWWVSYVRTMVRNFFAELSLFGQGRRLEEKRNDGCLFPLPVAFLKVDLPVLVISMLAMVVWRASTILVRAAVRPEATVGLSRNE